ncbi:hypothetical protein QBC38DRAFT_472624 [Podospora fimiseda]|uniref:Uncharacterized protein n=1 Tax=Podospora fimiseda TaxID=252190 RepID=A0AAN7BTM9_9PEZI|nr:hypothetical protein QBC38DRAFT_472624 [Podospora fimiseda]
MAVLVPPATQDAWSFSDNDFYVEVNSNRHRRATVPEIKAIYDGLDNRKDRPGHWYEAQLIHYGLPPSQTKGTAKMRLFDAVNKGNLSVPAEILKVESELKKNWTKRDHEIKQTLKNQSSAVPAKQAIKRKADDVHVNVETNVQVNVSLSIGSQGNVQIAGALPAAPASKKVKTVQKASTNNPNSSDKTPAKAKAAAIKDTKPAPKPTATASNPSTAKDRIAPNPKPTTAKASQNIQRARRGGLRPTSSVSSSVRLPNNDENIRPDNGMTPSRWGSYNDPPPPYSEPVYENDYQQYGDGSPLPALGLLNGRYCVESDGPRGGDSAIIFTLDRFALWGSFTIGPLTGILRLEQRPYQSSRERFYFKWRGEDIQGGEHLEPNDGSFIRFLGDGKIEGAIGFYGSMLEFEGARVPNQGTRSELSAFEMRNRWARYGYN